MLDDKLSELGKYIDEIEKSKPIDLLERKIKSIEEDISAERTDLSKKMNVDLIRLLQFYRDKGLSDSFILFIMYNVCMDLLRKDLIEEKIDFLGIDRTLYKDQMKLLFKGKVE